MKYMINKNILENKKIIIFDMDGTLIDSIGVWNEVDIATVEFCSICLILPDNP